MFRWGINVFEIHWHGVMFSLEVFISILKYWKIVLKQFGPQLTNNVSIADFEEVLNHKETRGVLRTPLNI